MSINNPMNEFESTFWTVATWLIIGMSIPIFLGSITKVYLLISSRDFGTALDVYVLLSLAALVPLLTAVIAWHLSVYRPAFSSKTNKSELEQ